MVEETLQTTRPESISLLRLDTDLYRSTYLELVHLYPMISAGGILLLDDYGGFQGVRVAVDQYFDETRQPIFLSRINAGVRLAVKLPSGV
jgi:O-methyltransferase